MPATTSSGASLSFKQVSAVAAALAALVALTDIWFYQRGQLLWFGDAQAHLNISRSLIDSRTPGYDQLGTVWLPLLHLVCLPFVGDNWLWSSGLAGTIPVSCCFVAMGTLLYAAARHVYQDGLAAAVVLSCLALNPNLLYLAAVPLTECVFLAGLALLLFAAVTDRFWCGIAACWCMCLTRYDGWFLLPAAAAWFALNRRRPSMFFLFGGLAALAPLYWIAHNWYETGNALNFFNGPYSPQAIQGGRPYPGLHNWLQSIWYYGKAGQLCSGWGLVLLGVAGFFCIANGRMLRPACFLLLIPLFYIWSMHSSGLPIFVPQLPPHGYYNSRYGIAFAVWAAFSAGAIVTVLPGRWRRYAGLLVAFAAVFHRHSIVQAEADVNSRSRLAWTTAAADFLGQRRGQDEGVLAPFGDLTGIFCKAGIPLVHVLHEGNGPLWLATEKRPDLFHSEPWVVTQRPTGGPCYRVAARLVVPGAPPLYIHRRIHYSPTHD